MDKPTTERRTVYIRSDGQVLSEEGAKRLKEGGYKGHRLFEDSMKKQLGTRHRLNCPLDPDAAKIVMSVKGVVHRALFVSSAIVKEAERRAKKGGNR